MLRRHFITSHNSDAKSYYFSVSDTVKVVFSPGNLQYTKSTDTWSFAERQYDYIGVDNKVSESLLADTRDLVGWSSTKATPPFGTGYSDNNRQYQGSFVDWGTNTIQDYMPNTWRTLTSAEWTYLIKSRPNASSLNGVAQVNGVNGVILLPDSWICPEGITFKSGFSTGNTAEGYYSSYQSFKNDEWDLLEANGAVFLPASGHITSFSSGVVLSNLRGYYWCATPSGSTNAYGMVVTASSFDSVRQQRYYKTSVRLVKDV